MRRHDWYEKVSVEYRTLGDNARQPESKIFYYKLADEYERYVKHAKDVTASNALLRRLDTAAD